MRVRIALLSAVLASVVMVVVAAQTAPGGQGQPPLERRPGRQGQGTGLE